MSNASDWFKSELAFRRLCGDALSKARSEKAMDFTREMMEKANGWGLDTPLTEAQLKWLCQLADVVPPKRIVK